MAILMVPNKDLKMLREALCVAMSCVEESRQQGTNWHRVTDRRIQELINQIDEHRPLGPDGKHGNLHTETCGCEDK